MNEKLKKEFIELICRLSPENLCCDGEISKAQVRRRLADIRREWKVLEGITGRRVSEEEAEKWEIEEWTSRKTA